MKLVPVPPRLRAPIALTAIAAAAVFVVAAARFGVRSEIALKDIDPDLALPLGIGFWVGLTILTSALPVRISVGSYVDLSTAPLMAIMNLGGPPVVAVAACVGTISPREVRGGFPWYGFVANRSILVLEFVLSSLVVELAPGRDNLVIDLLATTAGGACFFVVNVLIAAYFAQAKDEDSMTAFIRKNIAAFVGMLALAPLAWLMAQMYIAAGWWAVLLFAVPLYSTRVAYQRFVEIREMFTETARSLAEAVDKRDSFTSGHSHKVQEIAMDIGRELRVTEEELEALEWGGLLHDIGKIGIPDAVLLKQERLTREERETMNMHPKLGADIIAPVRRLAPELPIILHHHEWFNGSGYPGRLVGDEIPKLARILHVADAYEAMIAQRPYRMIPLTPEQALGELRKFGGIQFDPDVVDAFAHTKWVEEVPDPGRPSPREIAFLAEAALGGGGTAPAPA